MRITLYGKPITKKNSMQIISCGGRPRLIQSKAYRDYEKGCLEQMGFEGCYVKEPINEKIKVTCLYYLKDNRKTDLTNLLAATHDILQKAEIIEDDALIVNLDGSRIVGVDKDNPRVEIEIKAVG
jgi:Holliday junction resolvase RusA-like endonuclease